MVSCPHCLFENLAAATFCANCGRELAREKLRLQDSPARAREAERRFVTVLFADLSGFTALSETRDPEAVRELINACFDRLVPIIETHQGVVDQFVGDALVALFGAPVAHEDDPVQACRAALDMMRAMESINAARKLALGLHIGINSGMVLAGGIGSRGRQQYSVLGDAVNLASRLQDAAERGEIFVGAETYKLTRDQFEFVSRGAMPFKGKSEPQPVWQLLDAKTNAPAHRRIYTTTPMLGRERELSLLKRITRELGMQASGLQVVSILGDAGLGKSRLVQEWRDAVLHAAALPPHFVVAGCAPDGATHAYALLTELARGLRGAQNDLTETSSALQALLGTNVVSQNSDALDGAALQAQYTNALRELISQRAANNPLVLVCEDVHWADAASMHVLKRALEQLHDTRVLIAFTSRIDSETPGWSLMQVVQELPGAAATRLHLAPLAESDANALLASLVPGALPQEIQQLVLSHAEGNPLFVEELVRMLLDRGDLKRENEQWMLTRERVMLDVPNTLQGILMARIDQLPDEARHVLQIASVLGREFSVDTLEEMLRRTAVVSSQTG